MATPYAFVTLVTSDFYLPGALALVAALKDLHPSPPTSPEVEFQTVCLVTPETVDVSSIKLLRRAYNVVVGVEIIEQEDDRKLRLLGECPTIAARSSSSHSQNPRSCSAGNRMHTRSCTLALCGIHFVVKVPGISHRG